MLAAIAGGRLQGVELACLARKAGWQTLVMDRDPRAPARRLGDRFVELDLEQTTELEAVCRDVDILIPALEDTAVLNALVCWGRDHGVPVAFDENAYGITSSKIESNRLFASLNIGIPEPWPTCPYPIVAKPSNASGSDGVAVLRSSEELRSRFPQGVPNRDWVLQQYIEGPSFSLEVIGRPGDYVPLVCTELFVDAAYDCKAVAAPCHLSKEQRHDLEALGVALAEAVQLTGLMDVEVILHEGCFKVLEIDARFPSQTPLAVHAATGCNMLEMMGELFLNGRMPTRPSLDVVRGVRFEHIRVTPRAIFIEGEHIMGQAGPLAHVTNFWGADEALTNYQAGADEWVATLVVTGENREKAKRRYSRVLRTIQDRFDIAAVVDRFPGGAP